MSLFWEGFEKRAELALDTDSANRRIDAALIRHKQKYPKLWDRMVNKPEYDHPIDGQIHGRNALLMGGAGGFAASLLSRYQNRHEIQELLNSPDSRGAGRLMKYTPHALAGMALGALAYRQHKINKLRSGAEKSAAEESYADLAKEHRRVVKVLKSPSHKDDLEEAKTQEKELKKYEKKAKS